MSILSLYFGWNGRVGRGVYWLASIPILIIWGLLFAVAMRQLNTTGTVTPALIGIGAVLAVITFYSSLCIQVKRWHDRDKSAVWLLMNFLPYIGSLWVFIECGFLSGTPGPNRYDLDPEEKRALEAMTQEAVSAQVVRRNMETYVSANLKGEASSTAQTAPARSATPPARGPAPAAGPVPFGARHTVTFGRRQG